MNKVERLELWKLNEYILKDKILPLVKTEDLRIKVEYCFKSDNIEYYPNLMPIGSDHDKWNQEYRQELKRIEKEHYIRLFDKLY